MLNSLLVFLAAGLLALAFTPLAIRLAWVTGFLDRPTSPLKTQREPVAYLGGLAIALAFGLAVLLLKFTLDPSAGFAPWPLGLERGRGVYAIGLGGALALGLGLLDDRKALGPGPKFLGQVAGALVLVWCGLRVRFVSQAWLSASLTVLWVVTVTNALNFVDILDGLAGSVCAAGALVFWVFAVHGGRGDDALAAAALAGACLGFLPFNWKPARVYMGDAGSHFLGFTLAAISLNLRYSHQNGLAVLAPLVILFLPLFDLALMIVIRTRKGIAPWKGSPDHVPLRLKALGLSVPQVAAFLSCLTFALGMLVYAASFLALGAALWFWGGLAALALLAAFALMAVRMPHDVPVPAGGKPPTSGPKRRA
ncbi:MAG TPA: MraY family glycosyltransferase [bacterium]|jgi:UDP-GlcNAc:undecaprenyl-phosphate GlcNAc-1-phosphate transferase|nr:MraY family glycosyltransferase [bacterium]